MIATAFICLSIYCLFLAAECEYRVNTVNMPGGGGQGAVGAAEQHASIPDFMVQMMAAPQQRGESAVASALGAQEPAGAAAPAAAGEASDSAGDSSAD